MSKDADARARRLQAFRESEHGHCYVCGQKHAQGLQVAFTACEDGSVRAHFECARLFEGYPQQLHGGIICALLDGAMTNCLFAHGHVAVTAELTVRFSRPVRIGLDALVTARVLAKGTRLFRLEAEMAQDGDIVARATAKFMPRVEAPAATVRATDARHTIEEQGGAARRSA
jgi:uncharacterized protein (TIGR00369 family)